MIPYSDSDSDSDSESESWGDEEGDKVVREIKWTCSEHVVRDFFQNSPRRSKLNQPIFRSI